MSAWISRVAGVGWLLTCVSACTLPTAEGFDFEDEFEASEDAAATRQPVLNGALEGDHPAVVDFGFCSGALVAPNAIVTAAHCVDSPTGRVRVRVESMIDGARHCISADTHKIGDCGTGDSVLMRVTLDQHWPLGCESNCTAADDFAVLVLEARSSFSILEPTSPRCTNTSDCYYRIYLSGAADLGSRVKALGFGYPNSGLTWKWTEIEWMGSQHFWNAVPASNSQRMCKGDSGGPTEADPTFVNRTQPLLVGTHARTQFESPSHICTKNGGKESDNRTAAQLWRIEQALGRSCSRFVGVADSGATYEYARCW